MKNHAMYIEISNPMMLMKIPFGVFVATVYLAISRGPLFPNIPPTNDAPKMKVT